MPRSPSRDLADRFTGKRDYFRQPDGIRRAKNWLALAALGLAAGWAVVDATTPERVEFAHTHGPVAAVHARWEAQCGTCHVPQSSRAFEPAALLNAKGRWLDLTCETCHAGPAHHGKVKPDADGKSFADRCENCHHDHGGRDNSLVRLTDSHCTVCHAELKVNHAEGGYAAYPKAEAIASFPTDHPEFRELDQYPPGTAYPRGLKFSHALHMAPGQAYRSDGRKWSLADLKDAGDRERYRTAGQKDDAAVQLRCESCHRLDSGTAAVGQPGGEAFAMNLKPLADQPKAAILPPRPAGAYYLPVNYDLHCKACHPVAAPEARSGEAVIPSFAVPHRKQPAELKRILDGEFAARMTRPDNPKIAAPAGPGGRLDPRVPSGPTALRGEVERLADKAMTLFMAGATKAGDAPSAAGTDKFRVPPSGYACGKCHYVHDPNAKPEAQKIAPIPDKTVWFAHAKFNHAAHRGTACMQCHPNTGAAYTADGVTVAVNEREPIQIEGIMSCQTCHSPQGGFRHGCTDCHTYHNGDHPLQGRGAAARDPAHPLTVAEFFGGKRQPDPQP